MGELIFVFLLLPILVGSLLGAGGYLLMKCWPTALPWPLFLFTVLLGGTACNIAAVWYTGTWAFCSEGGLLGDNFTVLLNGTALTITVLTGLVASLFTRKLRNGKAPSAIAAWLWGWLLSQSALNILIFLLGFLPFQVFAGDRGLHPVLYLVLMTAAILALGGFFGYRWGKGHGPLVPLLGAVAFSGLGLFLAFMMLKTARDPARGLSLIQTRAGMLYSRLCLPSAILLGDYQYRWDITPVKVCLLTVLPHILFAAGYVIPGLLQRGIRHVQAHSEN